jgi:hypothetical protein
MDGNQTRIIRKDKILDSQKVLDTPLPQTWQPQANELVWLQVPRQDGKLSTFRVRVLGVMEDGVTVELFPEFCLATPFTYTAKVSELSPLD